MPRLPVSSIAPATSSRARPVSALLTDDRVIDATVQLLSRVGIDATTPAAVSREAHLSITAVRHRYISMEDFFFSIWTERCVPLVVTPMFTLIDEYITSLPTPDSEPPAALKTVLKQDDLSRATLEILTASAHLPSLLGKIQDGLYARFFITYQNDKVKVAQQATMLAVILGLLAGGREARTKKQTNQIVDMAHQVLSALQTVGPALPMPPVDSSYLDIHPFDTGDSAVDRLLDSCLRNVGKDGFGAVTTKQIAAGAGATEGLLFSKFPTKVKTFIAATTTQSKMSAAANMDFALRLVNEFGQAMGDALFLREWCRQDLPLQRSIFLEQLRLTWHIPEVRQAQQDALEEILGEYPEEHKPKKNESGEQAVTTQLQFALPVGIQLVALIFPDSWTLPYSAVSPSLS